MAELSPSNSVTNQIRKSVKRKKIIMRSIVGGVSALILGLGAGFIAIGVNRPYTTIDLNKTNLFIPDGFDKTINSRTTKEWTEPLTLEVYFNNHHQTEKNKYPDKMTNEWFDEHHGVDDIY
ncbi:hypothetical protein AGMMS50256_32180 [Betaproteobacteria bacterium]|nr:hypothetical protein AGMMS50256_32130 [Betaproteobacteria bacterium]GHU36076.1 hypothetical protein AGMMS50256_32180 [Betaproteobacteria bacterium]